MNPYVTDTSMFISKSQYEQMGTQIEELADKFEAERNRKYPGVIHKYTAVAFVNTALLVEFKAGKPVSASHNGIALGDNTCSMERKSHSDKEFPIPLSNAFYNYLEKTQDFTLTLDYVNDGCFAAHIAKASDA